MYTPLHSILAAFGFHIEYAPDAAAPAELWPEADVSDLLFPELPEAPEFGIGDLVAAYVGNCYEPSLGNVVDTCLNNFADNGRNWYKVDFGDFTLWLTDEDENTALRLVLKASAI